MNPEIVEQMYRRNPILRYTQHPLHAPLLPLPYGEVTSCECRFCYIFASFGTVKIFSGSLLLKYHCSFTLGQFVTLLLY